MQAIERKTTADCIYDSLREDIIAVRYKPGEKLSEAKLARRFGVSRAPVRDSLRKLATDGLVSIQPQVGTIVAPVSLESALDICQVRLLLEPHASGLAAKQLTKQQQKSLKHWQEVLGESQRMPSQKQRRALFDADSVLHETIWKACGNSEILKILSGYRDRINRIRLATADYAERTAPSRMELIALYKALLDSKPETASKEMQRHIENIAAAIRMIIAGRENCGAG